MDKIKPLSGFRPICAADKKIRDDKGYRNQIESYTKDHSAAEFSHSICPDCAQKIYGDCMKGGRGREKTCNYRHMRPLIKFIIEKAVVTRDGYAKEGRNTCGKSRQG